MMRAVHLHGHLAERFGREPLRIDIATTAEAVQALMHMRPGFREVIRSGWYRVIVRHPQTVLEVGEQELQLKLGKSSEIHFIPVVEGAGGRGIGKIIVGVALVASAIYFAPAGAGLLGTQLSATAFAGITFGNIALVGIGLALSGVSSLLSPMPKSQGPRESPDRQPSYLFNGPVNVTEQGHPVPIVIGRMRVGSVVASSGIRTENIPTTTTSGGGVPKFDTLATPWPGS